MPFPHSRSSTEYKHSHSLLTLITCSVHLATIDRLVARTWNTLPKESRKCLLTFPPENYRKSPKPTYESREFWRSNKLHTTNRQKTSRTHAVHRFIINNRTCCWLSNIFGKLSNLSVCVLDKHCLYAKPRFGGIETHVNKNRLSLATNCRQLIAHVCAEAEGTYLANIPKGAHAGWLSENRRISDTFLSPLPSKNSGIIWQQTLQKIIYLDGLLQRIQKPRLLNAIWLETNSFQSLGQRNCSLSTIGMIRNHTRVRSPKLKSRSADHLQLMFTVTSKTVNCNQNWQSELLADHTQMRLKVAKTIFKQFKVLNG